jgi:hypothetical protein
MDMARKFLQMGYTRAREGTPIISQPASTPRALESYCLMQSAEMLYQK